MINPVVCCYFVLIWSSEIREFSINLHHLCLNDLSWGSGWSYLLWRLTMKVSSIGPSSREVCSSAAPKQHLPAVSEITYISFNVFKKKVTHTRIQECLSVCGSLDSSDTYLDATSWSNFLKGSKANEDIVIFYFFLNLKCWLCGCKIIPTNIYILFYVIQLRLFKRYITCLLQPATAASSWVGGSLSVII